MKRTAVASWVTGLAWLPFLQACEAQHSNPSPPMFVFGCGQTIAGGCAVEDSIGIWVDSPEPPTLSASRGTWQWTKADGGWSTILRFEKGSLPQSVTISSATHRKTVRLQPIDASLNRWSLEARQQLKRGELHDCLASLEEAISAHLAAGNVFGAANDLALLGYLHIQHTRDLGQARAVLQRAHRLAERNADAYFLVHYNLGALNNLVGDLRAAHQHLSEAIRWATRAQHSLRKAMARQPLADLLHKMGRHHEATRLLAQQLPEAAAECHDLHVLNNYGWSLLTSSTMGSQPCTWGLPTHLGCNAQTVFERGLQLLSHCQNHPDHVGAAMVGRQNLWVNLALAALEHGNLERANQALEKAAAFDQTDPVLRMWFVEAQARLAAEQGKQAQALELFRLEEDLTHLTGSLLNRFSALAHQARILVQTGALDHAFTKFAAAHDVVFRQSATAPIAMGREPFFAQYRRVLFEHLDLLIDSDRPHEASQVLRRALRASMVGLHRSTNAQGLTAAEQGDLDRHLSTYLRLRDRLAAQAKERWQLPANRLAHADLHRRRLDDRATAALDEALALAHPQVDQQDLRAPEREEVLLVAAANGDGGAAFAVAVEGVDSLRWSSTSRHQERARAIVARFAPVLRRADRITIIADPVFDRVDWQTLDLDGRSLIHEKLVFYSLDIDSNAQPPRPIRRGLIVADTQGDLPAARRVVPAVERKLTGLGVSVQSLVAEAAKRQRMRTALQSADLLHYAGHADSGQGLRSRLLLAENGSLSLGDLLAEARAPTFVALLACESGKALGDLSLAESLLLRGARTVVATQRSLPDELARQLTLHLYGDDFLAEPRRSSAQAIARLAEHFPDRDWNALRVLIP